MADTVHVISFINKLVNKSKKVHILSLSVNQTNGVSFCNHENMKISLNSSIKNKIADHSYKLDSGVPVVIYFVFLNTQWHSVLRENYF